MSLFKLKYIFVFLLVLFLLCKLIKLALLCILIFIALMIIDAIINPKETTNSDDPHKKEPIYLKGESKVSEDEIFPNLSDIDDLVVLDEILDDEEE